MRRSSRARRVAVAASAAMVALFMVAGQTLACAGLIGPNGAVNLLRTTTFAGYHDGVEHYVTAFKFVGGGGKFGSIVPLPGIPTDVVRGGDWTLQRLVRETSKLREFAFDAAPRAAASGPEVLLQTRIDALDITILRGGGGDVGKWATDHGFRLPPDAPEVLDFYAQRSPIFMAASFDADAAQARGQDIGDGTPVHLTIPTANPWVPLRILGLGKAPGATIQADVFLLTDRRPALLPRPGLVPGLQLEHSAAATDGLLADLRSDKGMDWVPASAWLTQVAIDTDADRLTFDLAVDATGQNQPSAVAAGFVTPGSDRPVSPQADLSRIGLALVVFAIGAAFVLGLMGRRPAGARPT
jgi:hypothetical protein